MVNDMQLDTVGHVLLLKVMAYQGAGEVGRIDVGDGADLEQEGDAADVVLMAVRQEHAPDLLLILDEIGAVRDHQIHAVHVVLGEAQAAVDDDDVLAVLEYRHVLADLVKTAKRDNFQFFCQIQSLISV